MFEFRWLPIKASRIDSIWRLVAACVITYAAFCSPASAIALLGWRDYPAEGGTGVQIGGWSSDFGAQAWRVPANGVNGINFLEFPGSTVWEPGTDVTSESIEMDLYRRSFGSPTNPWQPVFAHARVDIGAGGTVSPAVVHSFSSTLGTAPGSGLNARANQLGRFAFSGISALTPLYWGIEWTVSVHNPTNQPWISGAVSIAIDNVHNDPMPRDFNLMTSILSGSWFGSFSTRNELAFDTSANINAFSGGDPWMPFDLDFSYRIAFSDTPFNDIPDPAVGVPEPHAISMLLLGLAGLGAMRRRVRERTGFGQS